MILKQWGLLTSLTLMLFSLELSANAHNQIFAGKMQSDPNMSLLIPARQKPSSHPVWLSAESFNSQESAVAAASSRFNPQSIKEDREYLGFILVNTQQDKPFYVYTVSHGDAGQNTVPIRSKLPQNFQLVAFWHTHGSEHWSRMYFSSFDTALAQRMNVPVYMASHSGDLLVYKPDDVTLSRMRAYSRGLGKVKGIAKGQAALGLNGPIRIATR